MNMYKPLRITTALNYLGWSQSELAGRLGVTPAYVSMLLHGRAPLTGTLVSRISFETGFPDTFFMMDNRDFTGTVTFRKKNGARSTATQLAEYKLLHETVSRLWDMLPMSDAGAWLDSLAPHGAVTPTQIERIAERTRRTWALDDSQPIRNLARRLDTQHVVVAALNRPIADGDGMCSPDPANAHPVIALDTTGKTGDRLRFTLAHELGHLILHRHRKPDGMEREANLFAGALLIPETAARSILSPTMSLRDYARVKAGWGISIAALIERAWRLNLLDTARRNSLRVQLSNRQWLKQEPVEVTIEEPLLMQQLVAQSFGDVSDVNHPTASRHGVEGFLGLPFEMVNHWCWDALVEREPHGIGGLDELL